MSLPMSKDIPRPAPVPFPGGFDPFQLEVLAYLQGIIILLQQLSRVPNPFETQLLADLQQIIDLLKASRVPGAATRIHLGLPITVKKGKLVVLDIELPNDAVQYFPIFVTSEGGVAVPAIPGDTYSVTMGAPASQSGTGAPLNAVIGAVPATLPDGTVPPLAGAVALVLNALNMLASGVPFEVKDADGLKVLDGVVNIVADVTPKNIALGPVAASVPQAVPAT